MSAISIQHGRFASTLRSPNTAVTALIRRVVPASGREYDASAQVWVIYGSRVERLLAALRGAGHDVVETGPTGGVA